jgi:hypothetical protein
VQQKDVIELVEQLQIGTIPFKCALPLLEQICHSELAATAPALDSRQLDKALRTPGDEEEHLVVLRHNRGRRHRCVPQPHHFAHAIGEPVEISLHVAVMVRQQCSEPALDNVI